MNIRINSINRQALPSPAAVLGIFCASFLLNASSASALSLGLPLRCTLGKDCFIQNYPDHDASPQFKDYRCGDVLGYNGHDGTDFRLPDYAAMRAGVEVIASAEGVVRGVRDGMEDVSVRTLGKEAIKNKECGNGIVIAHEGGWETQYCHMQKNSLRVKAGDKVAQGDVLGLVGLSGQTEFPHVHLSVRNPQKQKIDPFTGMNIATNCTNATTTLPASTLWNTQTQPLLTYIASGELNSGFSDHAITYAQVQQGEDAPANLSTSSPALVYWVHWYGLHRDDVITMSIHAPDGSMLATSTSTLDKNKATYFQLIGSKRDAGHWASGNYTGSYTITRKDAAPLQGKADLTVR